MMTRASAKHCPEGPFRSQERALIGLSVWSISSFLDFTLEMAELLRLLKGSVAVRRTIMQKDGEEEELLQ